MGTAASLLRGLVGEQKSRVIETVSTGGDAFVDKAAPQGVESRLEVVLGRVARRGGDYRIRRMPSRFPHSYMDSCLTDFRWVESGDSQNRPRV